MTHLRDALAESDFVRGQSSFETITTGRDAAWSWPLSSIQGNRGRGIGGSRFPTGARGLRVAGDRVAAYVQAHICAKSCAAEPRMALFCFICGREPSIGHFFRAFRRASCPTPPTSWHKRILHSRY